jgi:hypothetical protein
MQTFRKLPIISPNKKMTAIASISTFSPNEAKVYHTPYGSARNPGSP